jgi:LysR family transcriptional activator of glutamate synthase operon
VELRQLIYFDAVARCGGFTRAARQLHIAQPAVSVQVRQLEKELGVRLLARTSRTVSLTEAGELFLIRTRKVLAELQASRAEMDELAGVVRGHVTVGATQILGPLHLPDVLASFHATVPGLTVTLRAGVVSELLTRLDREDVDFVLAPIDTDLPGRYEARPLASEELVVITSTGHRLATRAKVSIRDLSDEVFVGLGPGNKMREVLDSACQQAGFRPEVQFEASYAGSVRELVSSGLGIALVTRSTAQAVGGPVRVLGLDPALPQPPFGIIRQRDLKLSAAAQRLASHLVRQSARPQPSAMPDR